ncbi:MAG: Omp28-related outer membrane protein [Bacteroidetes bacterium]|nr:Omp28-related outer membrane protein [Bacteroidota bacterium]MBL6963767.1 Omp28-related outer membrane protein [Bacteroidota bacterium]
MKNWISALLISVFFVFTFSCDNVSIIDDVVITTSPVTGITKTSAICGGTFISIGANAVTKSGVCWSTDPVPTIKDFKTEDGATTGTYISNLTDLTDQTLYYVCAYARTKQGVAYGNILSFTAGESFLAPTTPSNRVALLEDFTGVRCGYCPDGHARAKIIKDLYPDKFVIIAVHAGSYAAPASGWANFTTPYGAALVGQANVSGYPAGTMSRIKADALGVSPQKAGGYAMSRSHWKAAAEAVMQIPAPVNIGAKATYNPVNGELTVKVDLYYTQDGNGDNFLNIALLQDKLYSKQSGGTPDANNYEQNHVLRDMITGQWGEKVTTTSAGSKYTKTFTYNVPTNYNGLGTEGGGAVVINDLNIVAFVCQDSKNVLNALEVDVE